MTVDRTRRPAPRAVRAFNFPTFTSFRLSNGLRVIAAPDTRVPLALLRLVSPAGAENDPPGCYGLAALTAALLDEGTRQRSSLELAATVERLGGYLATGADWDSARMETSLLSRDISLGLELLSDIVSEPTFPLSEIDRLKQQTVAHLQRRRMQPAVAAADLFNRSLYREGPYSRPLLGTEQSLADIERELVSRFHGRYLRPARSTLVIVGDFEPTTLQQTVDEAFSPWQGRAPRPEPVTEPPPPEQRRVVLLDRPDSPQSEICVGQVGLRRSHPDFLVASVMNTLLGGKFTSRINLNLRERHGYTYGAHSRLSRRRGPGPFVVSAAVENQSVTPATLEVLGEIDRLRQDLVPEEELQETIDYLIGSFPYSCATFSGVAARLSELAVHELPDDYFSTLPELLSEVRPDDIRRFARAHFDPDRALVAVVGPAKQIAAPIARISPPEQVRNRPAPW